MEVMTQLEGAYALLIKSSHYPGELVACKRGSPLILGIKETPVHHLKRTSSSLISDLREIRKRPAGEAFEAFVASDASAVVEHTKRFADTLTPTLLCWQTLGNISTGLVHTIWLELRLPWLHCTQSAKYKTMQVAACLHAQPSTISLPSRCGLIACFLFTADYCCASCFSDTIVEFCPNTCIQHRNRRLTVKVQH